jgi:hypothetical protein
LLILSRSINKHGCHRQFLFLIGCFFYSSPLKPLGQMNRNLVGSLYGRSSVKIAHIVPIRPCLLMDRDKMSNLYKGHSIDASYQVSVHLAEGFLRRRLKCEKLTDDKWWQKLTLPLARWAKNDLHVSEWVVVANLKFVTLKRHTPDKFDQFLEDNFLTGRAISMTLCMKIKKCQECDILS